MQNAGDDNARFYRGAPDEWWMEGGGTNQQQLDAGLASSLEGGAGG